MITQEDIDAMMETPERIWARRHPTGVVEAADYKIDGEQEYIRADLAPRWRDIETAPKDGTEILVSTSCNEMAVVWWHKNYEFWAYYDDEHYGEFAAVVRWMPLPH